MSWGGCGAYRDRTHAVASILSRRASWPWAQLARSPLRDQDAAGAPSRLSLAHRCEHCPHYLGESGLLGEKGASWCTGCSRKPVPSRMFRSREDHRAPQHHQAPQSLAPAAQTVSVASMSSRRPGPAWAELARSALPAHVCHGLTGGARGERVYAGRAVTAACSAHMCGRCVVWPVCAVVWMSSERGGPRWVITGAGGNWPRRL